MSDVVMSSAKPSDVSKAIALPMYLTADDGRRFEVLAWRPIVDGKQAVRIEMACQVTASSHKGGKKGTLDPGGPS